jgi:hypothetical protein
MAIPTLKHQIEFVDTIVLMRATSIAGDRKYKIDEVLKSKHTNLQPDQVVNADFSIFELIGYKVWDGQQIVAFLAIRENLTDYDCVDFLPVIKGSFVYGRDDLSVRRELMLDDFRAMVRSIE